ncbi:alpha-glucosidase [Mucilaginibacter sp. PPCGB 2223]|uniref:glycoside hydrolase family 97 protein n=1 Tax=Mucilaginibacter sp. PPCGB 2223 TaxID=1886027 RepID=UPI0008250D26|nr:glycoside hydrolase family 97 protein [Mucilaginibacter sp. PPCGB 2223]OCX52244.1 alpha-glucosidase [Mucilaginibacter sp. PPCGB 2223]
MKKISLPYLLILVLGAIWASSRAQQTSITTPVKLYSPDHRLEIQVYQKADAQQHRALYYRVYFKNQPVILESLMELEMDNNLSERAMALKVDTHQRWFENLSVSAVDTFSTNTSWVPVAGERHQLPDHYNSAVIKMVKDDNPIYTLDLEVRAYDEGAAFRFRFPENAKGTYYNITAEHTEFSLPEGSRAWVARWAQAPYELLPLKDWPDESERPLTIQLPDGTFAALAEGQMTDYARTKFRLSPDKPNTILTSMFGGAELISPFVTPWRVIMVADRAGDLIEHNYLLPTLNPISPIKDVSWIKPGKIMRVMNLTTADAKANIDFAVQQHLQYVLFDAKWYGQVFSFSSDATKVAIPDFNLPEIIRYGTQNGIGIWLYVNQQALLAQSDSLFSIYHKWGVKGVKFGFVQVGSHRWSTWTEKAIRQAADNQLMVNIHDDWRPTGEQRTWPNLMTAEGIRGNEEMPDATHNTVVPFTRYLAGPADYTICYFDKRIKTTHAHQLALAAVYYSPVQTLFWYDSPSRFKNEPELEFWRAIPTTWDDTKVIDGAPGKFIITARRKNAEWFIGAITNNDSRSLNISFSFLPKGITYDATIYSDDPNVATATHVRLQHLLVNQGSVLKANLLASGGEAIHLIPANNK